MNYLEQLLHDFSQIGLKDIGVIFAILVMDAALSADNSVAINALALNVRENLRSQVIWCGMGLAAVLRVVALMFAAFIIANPWVQVIGAGYLMYLFYGHFFKSGENDDGVQKKVSSSFWGVLAGIGFLDLSLSTDNVIAVVAMSQNFAVVVIGVLVSIFLLAVASQVVRKIMEYVPSLESAAYVILLFLSFIMLSGHFAETISWLGNKTGLSFITGNEATIMRFKYDVSDMYEILGVAIIISCAVIYDKVIKKQAVTA